MPRKEAAIQGAREIAFAVLAMTLTLASVFAPLAFATGRTGTAVHRVRAHARRRGAGLRLRRADALADDVLAAAQARGEAFVRLQPDRGLDRRPHQRLSARARRRRCARAGWWSSRWIGGAWRGRRVLPAAQGRALADRGPRRRLRPRHRAAGLDAAVHRGPDPSDRGVVRAAFRRAPRTPRSPAFRPWSTAMRCCASSPGRSARASSSRSPRSCVRSSRRSPARSPSRSTRRRSASRSARTPIDYIVMSQMPYAELQRLVDRFLDELRKEPAHPEPADRPAAQHAGGARRDQPRQALRHRRRRSTPSGARSRPCSAAGR